MDISISDIQVPIQNRVEPLFEIKSLHIPFKEKILIKGHSGSGKSTLLHLIAGLFSLKSGSVTIGSTSLENLTDEERARFRREHIAVVFQKLNLIDHLTVLENIMLTMPNRQLAQDCLSAVRLTDRMNDPVSVLSLGEQQRVAVGRVLASSSEIVLADEPTSSLDEKNADDVIKLLLKACKDKTLIVVSHDHRIEKYFSKKINFEEFTK